jgi:hypothetical protein
LDGFFALFAQPEVEAFFGDIESRSDPNQGRSEKSAQEERKNQFEQQLAEIAGRPQTVIWVS